jgi:molecular chaperone GrpE
MNSDSNKRKAQSAKQAKDLQQQVGELTEALQRERADAANIRRRHDEQIAGLKDLVKANIVRELLPVIDNFERAFKHYKQEWDLGDERHEWIKGIRKLKEQFEATLAQMDVERIKTVGEVFDPKYHEAVSMEDGNGEVEVVCEELQPGYKLGDEVIRHAMVKVKMEGK